PLGILTEAKHQQNCGACWAIAATTAFADRYAVRYRVPDPPRFNYTSVLTCCRSADDQGCCGGVLYNALVYLGTHGVPTTDCVDETWLCPHAQQDQECHTCSTPVSLDNVCQDLNAL